MAKKKRSQAKRRVNKLPFIIAGIVLAVALIAAGVYAVVSPSPEERMARGLIKLLESNTISIESTSLTKNEKSTTTSTLRAVTDKKAVDADFATKIEAEGQDTAEVKAEILIPESGDMYAKIDDPKQSLKVMMNAMLDTQFAQNPGMQQQSEMMANMRRMMTSHVDTMADKMGDKWVRVPKQELAITSMGQEVNMSCYVDFVRATRADADARRQLIEYFRGNNFITIDEKLENKGTSAGYRITVDQQALEKFIKKAQDNAVFSKVLDCDPALSLLTNAAEGQMDIWVDRFSHSITHMELANPGAGSSTEEAVTEVHFGYSGRVQAAEPENSIDMSELTGTPSAPAAAVQPAPATE